MRINPVRARLGRWDHGPVFKHFSGACCSSLLWSLWTYPLSFLVPLPLLLPMTTSSWAPAVPSIPFSAMWAGATGWPPFPVQSASLIRPCSSPALLREASPRRWSGRSDIEQQRGIPQSTPNLQQKGWCLYFSRSLQFQSPFSEGPTLLLSWAGLFFTEFIFLQLIELRELIKGPDKHQTCTKKAAGLGAEVSFLIPAVH